MQTTSTQLATKSGKFIFSKGKAKGIFFNKIQYSKIIVSLVIFLCLQVPSLAQENIRIFVSAPGQMVTDLGLAVGLTESVYTETYSGFAPLPNSAWATGPTGYFNPNIGRFVQSGTAPTISVDSQYGAGHGDFLSIPVGGQVSLKLNEPTQYFGFAWAAGDGENTIFVYRQGVLLFTFTTDDVVNFIPNAPNPIVSFSNGNYLTQDYYGKPTGPTEPTGGQNAAEPYAYLHIVATEGLAYDSLIISQFSGGSFETDNHSAYFGVIPNETDLPGTWVTVATRTPPQAFNDLVYGNFRQPIVINALGNDTAGESPIDAGTVQILGTAAAGDPLVVPNEGTWSINGTTGAITFTPDPALVGSPTPIGYRVSGSGTPPLTSNAATVTVIYQETFPDFGTVNTNTTLNGNVNTNDLVVAGTEYDGEVLTSGPVGGDGALTLNLDGTYSFSASVPGVYIYTYDVCAPGATPPCPTETLQITVIDPNSSTNPPIANPDVANTLENIAVIIDVLENDEPGNAGGALDPSSVSVTGGPANGSTSVNATTGEITYTPDAAFTGVDTFTYEVDDTDNNGPTTTTVEVRVFPTGTINTVIGTDDYNTTYSRENATGNVLTNDSQLDNTDPLEATPQTTTNTGGRLVLLADGSYTFTPTLNFVGTASFDYQVVGTDGASAIATIFITVNQGLDTEPDVETTLIGSTVSGNVSTNDVVPSGTTYSYSSAGGGNPAADVPTINPDGSYTFNPTAAGVYVFNIQVCAPTNPNPPCKDETLTITVSDPSSTTNPPIANNDLANTLADANPANPGVPVTINVIANDQAGNAGGVLDAASTAVVSGPSNGSLVNNGDGTITYTPDAGFSGVDTFTYSVDDTDNNGPSTATVTINVYPAGTGNIVTAADDYKTTYPSTSTTGNVLTNDSQLDGTDPLEATPQSVTNGTGTLTLLADGSYTFTPAFGFLGTSNFPYEVTGTDGATANATLHITVNAGITATPDVAVGFVDQTINGDVSTNDVVPVGSTYSGETADGGNPGGATVSFTLNPDGTFDFETDTPGVYVYTFDVCSPTDPTPPCVTGTLTITVTDPAITTNPPVANNDLANTLADANPANPGVPVAIDVLENDEPGNPGGALDPSSVSVTSGPANGSTSVNATTGEITYTPDAGFSGVDTFTYSVDDTDNNGPSTATVTINVYPAGTGNIVTAADDYAITYPSANATGNVLTNDSQLDGTDPLEATPQSVTNGTGTLTLLADGSYTFTPALGFVGTSIFPYEVTGTDGATANATLHITVNAGITATPDVAVGFVDQTINGDVSTNDVVPSGSTYSGETADPGNPVGATVSFTLNPDGTFDFETDIPGVYVYTYDICSPTNPTPPCVTGSLTITVTDPSSTTNPPVANNDFAVTYADANPANPGVAVPIDVVANDQVGNTGGSIDATTVSIGTAPANGSTSINATTGVITYTPDAGFTGVDTFTYSVDDTDNNGPSTATVTINVYPAGTGNIVIAADDYASTNGITPVSGNVLTNDTQLSGVVLTTVTNPNTYNNAGEGSLLLNANGTYTFTPEANFEGSTSFVYTAQGTDGATASATLHITVYPPLTYTWTGADDDDWCNVLNWDLGSVPVAGANIRIENTGTPPVISNSCNVCINNLTIDLGASLTIPAGETVCVTGTLDSQGTVLDAGNIAMRGVTAQTIIGDFNISNLEIDNPTGVTITAGLGNMVNITESIKLTQGALTTNDNLRLISDASGDAYFAPISDLECAVVSIIGNVRIQKFVAGNNRAFRFIAHPFNGTLSLQQIRDYVHITGEGLDFNDTGNPSAFWYNTAAGNQAEEDEDTGWVAVSPANIGDWFKGRAVRMLFRGPRSQGGVVGDDDYVPQDVTYELIGEVNLCEQILVGLVRSGNPGDGVAGSSAFNFIGNPYPAAIDLKTIPGGDRTNIGPNYYVWQPRTGVQGDDTVYGPGGGRGGNYVAEPFDGGTPVLGQLATGTGFFVVANIDNASLTFTEANKLAQKQLDPGAAVTFREDGDIASRYGVNTMQLAIDIDGQEVDRVLVYFDDETDAKVDIMDATKFENPSVNFFTVSADDYAMAIDRRPWVDEEEYRIPLHILSPAVKFTLTVPDFDMESGRTLQLYDRHLDELITLEKGATYEFEVTDEQASKGHRFDIVMGIEVITSINPTADRFQAFLLPNPAQQQVMVSIQRPDEIADTHVRLVDIRGVMLYETTIKATDDAQISYEVGSLAKGVYLVEITHGKQRIVKRLMVN
ncbi:Ig-like domain-containing protein [Fulvivirgaceae bacterium LMO-SS25]